MTCDKRAPGPTPDLAPTLSRRRPLLRTSRRELELYYDYYDDTVTTVLLLLTLRQTSMHLTISSLFSA